VTDSLPPTILVEIPQPRGGLEEKGIADRTREISSHRRPLLQTL
jgi:hypothetical protein